MQEPTDFPADQEKTDTHLDRVGGDQTSQGQGRNATQANVALAASITEQRVETLAGRIVDIVAQYHRAAVLDLQHLMPGGGPDTGALTNQVYDIDQHLQLVALCYQDPWSAADALGEKPWGYGWPDLWAEQAAERQMAHARDLARKSARTYLTRVAS